jgi:hypothetical protein
MIKLGNKKHGDVGVYVGRPSILGNPFKVGRDGSLEEVIAKYRVWLWGEIKKHGSVFNKLVELVELSKRGDLTLVCWCSPLPCHAEIIRNAIMWMRKQS